MKSGELVLTALHPGAAVEQARENTGWDLKDRKGLARYRAAVEEELRILREELDPQGIYLKGSA